MNRQRSDRKLLRKLVACFTWEGAAFVVSLCAFGLSSYQAFLGRQQQRLAVKPVIHLDFRYNQGKEAGISLSNRGLGPAVIRSMALTLDGKSQTSWEATLRAIGAVPENNALEFARYPSRSYYQQGFEGDVIKVVGVQAPTAFRKAFDRMHLEVCYCSLYEECWTSSLPMYSDAIAVHQCTRPVRELDQ